MSFAAACVTTGSGGVIPVNVNMLRFSPIAQLVWGGEFRVESGVEGNGMDRSFSLLMSLAGSFKCRIFFFAIGFHLILQSIFTHALTEFSCVFSTCGYLAAILWLFKRSERSSHTLPASHSSYRICNTYWLVLHEWPNLR